MTRSRATAKQAGSSHERSIADYLKERLSAETIDRRVTRGKNDAGDIGGMFLPHGGALAIECKNYGGRVMVGPWLDEAERERGNADAVAGIVIAKRRGTTKPGEQIVLMTVDTLLKFWPGVNS